MENKGQKTRSKFLMVLNTLMLLVLLAVPTYAFFWGDNNKNSKVDINVGVEDGLTLDNQNWTENGILIPTGTTATREDEVHKLVYTFELTNKGTEVVDVKLEVALTEEEVDELKLEIKNGTETINDGDVFELTGTAKFTVTFTLDVADSAAYIAFLAKLTDNKVNVTLDFTIEEK